MSLDKNGWFYLSKTLRFKIYHRDGWDLIRYEQRFDGHDWELWHEGPVNPAEHAMWGELQHVCTYYDPTVREGKENEHEP